MKITATSLSALALAPAAIATPLEARGLGKNCAILPWTKNVSSSTTYTVKAHTDVVTQTKTDGHPPTITVDRRKTTTDHVTISKKGKGTATVHVTQTKKTTHVIHFLTTKEAKNTKTITAGTTTTTVPTSAGFTPVGGTTSSASGSVTKRAVQADASASVSASAGVSVSGSGAGNGAGGAAAGIAGQAGGKLGKSLTLCSTTITKPGTETATSTVFVVNVAPSTTVLTGTVVVTDTATAFANGQTTTDTTTTTSTVNTVSTTTIMVTSTVIHPAHTASVFQACMAPNLLNFTASANAGAGSSLGLGSLGGSNSSAQGQGQSAGGLLSRSASASGSGSAITQISLNPGFNTTVVHAINPQACCAACFMNPLCAGSFIAKGNGTCTLVLTVGASCGVNSTMSSNSFGTFSNGPVNSTSSTMNSQGFIVSNGHCGMWSNTPQMGGSPTSQDPSDSSAAPSSSGSHAALFSGL